MSIVRLFKGYNSLIDQQPLKTKSITCFFLFSFGDYICQKLELKYKLIAEFSNKRCLMQGSFGLIGAPYLHLQYCKIMPYLFPENSKYIAFKSIVYSLTISDGLSNLMFYIYMDLISGKGFQKAIQESKKKFIVTMIANWQFWPLISTINFTLIPIQYRVLFDNLGSIFWNIYLSFIQNKKDKPNEYNPF